MPYESRDYQHERHHLCSENYQNRASFLYELLENIRNKIVTTKNFKKKLQIIQKIINEEKVEAELWRIRNEKNRGITRFNIRIAYFNKADYSVDS